ncbi:MAG: dihydrofolate synthase / folylpolyglutamate synthase [Clostridia bacterium]|jgi:dihydrofolate synthase/folylpolyglutamate synthase|nr:FolC bifunctional protein [Clostridiales bacterium]MDK2984463.1 dihydrofolate synthase / folylpolyglutamate synthase [Clostridia bacterium]
MDYRESIQFLKNLTKFGMNFGLERIEKLLSLLGNPHEKLQYVHVGGTNGKGSTCMVLTNILKNSGYDVGLFTSPHIHSYRERFTINGEMITEKRVAALISKMRPYLEKMVEEGFEHPTEFEVNTAMAFQYFYEENVDLVVVEVGLGGAIDSTNVIKPLISIITNVAMDHMNYLGNTIAEIATVKAGIIKEGVPVITGATQEALEVIEEVCSKKRAPLIVLNRDVKYQAKEISIKGSSFDYFGKSNFRDLKIALLGEHQISNAVMAVKAAEILRDEGFVITEDTIRKGLSTVSWPARLEIFQRENPTILLDVAHNVDGMMALKNTIERLFNYKRMILVLSLLEDKEREKVVQIMSPLAETVIVTKPNSDRAGDWEKVADFASKYCSDVVLEPEITEAIKTALSKSSMGDLLCITGSFYMVCDARMFLNNYRY